VRDAFALLTILPTGRYRSAGKAAVLAFPLVGLVVGGIQYGVALVARPIWGVAVTAVLVVLSELVVSGGMHMDAVADISDAVGSRKRGEEGLAIARDSRIGAFGAMAVAGTCLLLVAADARLIALGEPEMLVAAAVTARTAMLVALLLARGNSSAGEVARNAGTAILASGVILGSCLAVSFAGVPGILGVLVGVLIALMVGAVLRSRFGEVTGDGVGACGVAAQLICLMWLAAR